MSYIETSLTYSLAQRKQPVAVQRESYVPQPGDIIVFDSQTTIWKILFALAGSHMPDHAAIVVAKPDGKPALLEAGPFPNLTTRLEEWSPRMRGYDGVIWVRRLKEPLSARQSQALTQFATEQDGKRYAIWRFLLQGTPFSARRLLSPFATTYDTRWSWLCSELVVSAATCAGVMTREGIQATATYPCDLLEDQRFNLKKHYSEAVRWRSSGPPMKNEISQPGGARVSAYAGKR